MHYKNGREAQPGDRVVDTKAGLAGILHSIQTGTDTCNGRLASPQQNDPYINIKDCLHIDDIAAATIPDVTKS